MLEIPVSNKHEFWFQWVELLMDLIHFGEMEHNERTGKDVHVIPGARFIKLNLSNSILPTCGVRKTNPKVAAAETAWQILGHNHLGWLRKHTHIWDKFAIVEHSGDFPESDEDFKIPFAYGHRMRNHFGRDQLRLAVEALSNNKSDRRCHVALWDPSIDGLGATGQTNVPCPVGFTLNIVRSYLHMAVNLRSSDVFVGLPYDVMNFAMLMGILCAEIRHLNIGTLSFTLDNAHLYDSHFKLAQECLKQQAVLPDVPILFWPMHEVEQNPDAFVTLYKSYSDRHVWPIYDPKPEVHL